MRVRLDPRLREITSLPPPEPTISVACDEAINRVAQRPGDYSSRVNQPPPSSGGSDELYPRVRLGQAPLAIQDQECQRVIRIIAMLSQQRPTQIALHRNQVKRGLTLVML